MQCPQIRWYGSGQACTPCPKVRCPRDWLLALKEAWKDRSTGRSNPGDAPRRISVQPCRSSAGRSLSWRLPYVAARRLLEPWRGSSSFRCLQRGRSADDLPCSGGAQDATSVRRCSPPALERCRGGRITDSSPYDRAVGYNGCSDAYAGAASSASILNRCDGHCTLHAGPYCSVCASGYFRKGKICAVCDDSTKNVMYVKSCASLRRRDLSLCPVSSQGWA